MAGLGVVDGRTQRRLRNEDAAVDAFVELLGEGNARPTAQQVADRSGVSIRSIFRLFEDVDSLHAAAVARQSRRVGHLQRQVPADGPVTARIDALVASFAQVYETIAPVRRLAVQAAATSPAVAAGLVRHRRGSRAQLRTTFAPELAGLAARDRIETAEAIEAVTSWETWDGLRSGQGLSPAAARRVVRRLLVGLLT